MCQESILFDHGVDINNFSTIERCAYATLFKSAVYLYLSSKRLFLPHNHRKFLMLRRGRRPVCLESSCDKMKWPTSASVQ